MHFSIRLCVDSDVPQEENFDRRSLLNNQDNEDEEEYPQGGMDDEISAYRRKLLEKSENEIKFEQKIKSEDGAEVYRFQPPSKKMR